LALERGFGSWSALKKKITDDELRGRGLSPEAALHALFQAASRGDAPRVVEIADAWPAIISRRGELTGHDGHRTALHFGARHEAVVRALLERGADPNVRDDGDNAMPLHFAAEDQSFPIIRLLVEHGADTIGTGDMHELEIVDLLLLYGADPTARSNEGTTAADWAAKRGMTAVVARLKRGLSSNPA
jgi:hypothetical protein